MKRSLVLALSVAIIALGFVGSASAAHNCQFRVSASTITLLNDCWTNETFYVPNKRTFNGAFKTITVVDPSGGPFQGAVIAAVQGGTAKVNNVNIVSNLADTCGAPGSRLVGIMFNEANGAVDRVTVTMNRGTSSNCQEGTGILVKSSVPPGTIGQRAKKVTIKRSKMLQNHSFGILASGWVNVPVDSTDIIGYGPVPNVAQIGIKFQGGAIGTFVKGNITDHMHVPMNGEPAAGVLLELAGKNVKVDQSGIRRNDRGVHAIGANSVTVSKNRIVDSTIDGILIEDHPDLAATFCKITDNESSKNGRHGIYIRQNGTGLSVYKNMTKGNLLTRNDVDGIRVEGNRNKVMLSTFSLNDLFDIEDVGVETYFVMNVCSTKNWYGVDCGVVP